MRRAGQQLLTLKLKDARSDDDRHISNGGRDHPCEIKTAEAAGHVDIGFNRIRLSLSEHLNGVELVPRFDNVPPL